MQHLSRKHQAYFNSQPHKEADDSFTFFIRVRVIFQLTASQGG